MSTSAKSKSASRKFAKSVIEIWLWGGPSQLETFDPKPDAPHDYNNGLKTVKTNTGIELHEWMTELAKCADLYSIIRSMTPQERRNPEILNASRRRRIAKGAGVEVQDVNQLIRQFDQAKQMLKQMMGGNKFLRRKMRFGR